MKTFFKSYLFYLQKTNTNAAIQKAFIFNHPPNMTMKVEDFHVHWDSNYSFDWDLIEIFGNSDLMMRDLSNEILKNLFK